MTAPLSALIHRYHNLILFVLFALLSYFLIVVIVKEKLEDFHNQVEVQIKDQQALLATIAETTARNGADTITEAIVQDCSLEERTTFDELLERLDKGLSKSELTVLERLFGRCGSFYSERKAVMVARLTREIEVYDSYVLQLKTISDKKTVESYQVETWQQLAEVEKSQSDQFAKLVELQEKIISTLLSGKNSSSPEIQSILGEVKQTQQILASSNTEAATIRTQLLPL